MEDMKIGLAAHIGSDAEISNQKFKSFLLLKVFLYTVLLGILAGIFYFSYQHCKETKHRVDIYEEEEIAENKTKSNNRYLPNSKDTEVSDHNSLLGTPKSGR